MGQDNYLPDWLEQGVEPALRDAEEDAPPAPTYVSSVAASAVPFSSSSRATPIVLTPTGPSPAGSYVRQESGKSPWTDLDKFYEGADDEGEEEEEEDEEGEEGEEEGEEEEESEEESEGAEHHDENGDTLKASDEEESADEEGDTEDRRLLNTS